MRIGISSTFHLFVTRGILTLALLLFSDVSQTLAQGPAVTFLPDSLQKWVGAQDSIRVGIDPTWPPIEWYDEDNNPRGLSVDLLEYIASVTGLNFSYMGPRPWSELVEAARVGDVDLLPGVVPVADRESFLTFVSRYDSYPIMIYTRDDVGYVQQLGVLSGKRVAFIEGYVVGDWVTADYPGIERVYYSSALDALEALQDEQVFAFLDNPAVVDRICLERNYAHLKVSGITEYSFDLAFGVRKSMPELAAILHLAMENMSQQKRNQICSVCLEPGIEKSSTGVWLSLIALGLILLMLHNNVLRRIIRRRTTQLQELNQSLEARVGAYEQVQRDLQTSELRYQEIVNSTYDALLVHDVHGAILEVNERTAQLFGYSQEEMLRCSLGDLCAGGEYTLEGAMEHLNQALAKGTDEFEWRCKRKDGSEFWGDVALRASLIAGETRLIATVRNMDERRRALDELATTRTMLEATLDQTPAGIVVLDNDGVTRYINRAACDISALDEQGFYESGEKLPPLARNCVYHDGAVPDPDDQPVQRALREGIATRNQRMLFTRPRGETRELLVSAAPIRNLEGKVVAAIGVYVDVSDQTRTTAALHETEIRYRQLFESASDAIFLMHGERFIDCNTRTLTLFGCSRADIIGQSPDIFSPPFQEDGRPSAEAAMEHINAVNEGLPQFFDWIHSRLDGVPFFAEVSLSLINSEDQDLVLAIVRDVSDRRRAEDERGKLATVVEQATEDVMLTDKNGVIQYVNPAFTRITGYSREEAIGKTPSFLRSGLHSDEFYRDLWNTVGSGRVWRGTLTNRHADGSNVIEDAIISPMCDSTGSTIGFVAVKRDITDRVQLEEQLRHAQKMEAVGQLAGGVAHDFNNLLQVIMGYTEMVRDDKEVTEQIHEYASEVLQAGNRARSLIQQLLAFSRRDALQLKRIDLNQVLAGSVRMVHRLIGTNIMLDFQPGEIGMVMADAGQMEQIIVNLCINSRDAMPEGGFLKLVTRAELLSESDVQRYADAVSGHYVRLSVIDTGIGIPLHLQDRIFEPFFTTKGVNKGTGLGLATVYAIVRRHGGFIAVDSEEQRGTAFHLYLPEVESACDTSEHSQCDTDGESGLSGQGETILLAEDDPQVRELATSILQQAGYNVILAEDGDQAVQQFEDHQERINLALLDVIMPRRNGRQVYEYLHEIKPELPVLFASGFSFELQEGKELPRGGERALVQKPYVREELLRRLRQALENRGSWRSR